jgi:hypothetical protein
MNWSLRRTIFAFLLAAAIVPSAASGSVITDVSISGGPSMSNGQPERGGERTNIQPPRPIDQQVGSGLSGWSAPPSFGGFSGVSAQARIDTPAAPPPRLISWLVGFEVLIFPDPPPLALLRPPKELERCKQTV